MNNLPAMTDSQRQDLIEWAKGYTSAAETYVANNPNDRSGKAHLELLQIALATLTAEPHYHTMVGNYYTAPPVPALKQIELPKAEHEGGDPFAPMVVDIEDVKEAIRAAGYEVVK